MQETANCINHFVWFFAIKKSSYFASESLKWTLRTVCGLRNLVWEVFGFCSRCNVESDSANVSDHNLNWLLLLLNSNDFAGLFCLDCTCCRLTLSYRGRGAGEDAPLLFFLHHPKTAQGIKLKLSDFKYTPLRHIFLQVKPVRFILSCYKITEGTSQDLTLKKSENQPFVKILSWNLVYRLSLGQALATDM